MKKRLLIASAVVAAIAVIVAGVFAARKFIFKKPIIGSLNVISYTPQGDEVPISTDGISVMFDRAVVPLTTLDAGRDKSVDLKIEPSVQGKFFWLGTHGFIFRPASPLDPATTYSVQMPAGIVSVEGYRLDQPLSWSFSTVRPRVMTWEPEEKGSLLPKDAQLFLRFNIAMNKSDVETKLAFSDAASGEIISQKREYVWGDDGHTLQVVFKEELPWASQIKAELPAGVMADKGGLGISDAVTVNYTTPEKDLRVEKVFFRKMGGEPDYEVKDIALKQGRKESVPEGSGICLAFSQPISKKSFEKALHIESPSSSKEAAAAAKKPQPYFYFGDREEFPKIGQKKQYEFVEGYKEACAAFLDDYERAYTFFIDPQKIESLSGAALKDGGEKYTVVTEHASPDLRSLLTKNILSLNAPMKLPYRGINIGSVTLRLYRITDKSLYNEHVKDERAMKRSKGADAAKEADAANPGGTATISDGKFSLPIDPATGAIDQARMPATFTQEFPVEAKRDVSRKFYLDMSELPEKPGAGIYLVEAKASPSAESTKGRAPEAVYSMIQITPVALAIMHEAQNIMVWATDIEKGSAAAQLPLRVTVKRWNSKRSADELVNTKELVTNEQGVAIMQFPSDEEMRACVEVTKLGSESYSCEEDHLIGGYPVFVSGGIDHYAYVYTDRPIYRPGQKVQFSSFVREVREGRYFMPRAGSDISVEATDSSGQRIFANEKAALEPGGIVSGEFVLPEGDNAPRGAYSLTVTADKQKFSRTFIVSSYRKPSFKVDVTAPTKEIVSRSELEAQVHGAYFFGAPLKKAKAHWSIMTNTFHFSPDGYSDYSFIDEDLMRKRMDEEGEEEFYGDYEYDIVGSSEGISESRDQYDDPRESGRTSYPGDFFKDPSKKDMSSVPVELDDKGELAIHYKPDLAKYPASQTLTVEASIEDPSHQEVSNSEEIVVHKADFYLGLKPEKWVVGSNESAKIDLVSLDTKGKPVSGKGYSVDVLSREYKFIERRNARGYWELVFEPSDTKLKSFSGRTDGEGKATVDFQIPKGGEFRFVASSEDGAGNKLQAAATVFAWGEGFVPWKLSEPEKIELVPDKEAYKVGETAKVLVKSLVPVTRALLTIERGRMLDYRIIELGGNASHIEIPVTEGMMPNIFLSVIAHAGRDGSRPPMLFTGQTELHVASEKKRLSVTISTDRKGEGDKPPIYRPAETVKVSIKTADSEGKPRKAHVIVSVADESVLRLLNYQLPDLIKKFYYERPNGVMESSSLISLKAGDAGSSSGKKRKAFRDTAFFKANVTTDEKGEASVSFALPDDLTTWVIEALAITDSKYMQDFEVERNAAKEKAPAGQNALGVNLVLDDGTFVGSSRANLMTTLPLSLRTALPRFAAWGDQLRGSIIANNRNTSAIDGKITVSATGGASLAGDKASEIVDFSIPAGSEKSFPIELRANPSSSDAVISASAVSSKGEQLDALEVKLPIKDRFASEVVKVSGMTQAESKELIDIPGDVMNDRGGLGVSFAASMALAAAPSLKELIYFPWGCSEQKSASLIALIIAKDMTSRFGEVYFDGLAPIEADIVKSAHGVSEKMKLLNERIANIVSELIDKFQTGSGGMRYWPEGYDTNFMASVQTLAAFALAANAGVEVDGTARKRLEDYVRTSLRNDDKAKLSTGLALDWDMRAFGLWALALDGDKSVDQIAEVMPHLSEMSISGFSYLSMAAKLMGRQEDARTLNDRIMAQAKMDPAEISWSASKLFWSSAAKNTALASLALLTSNPADANVPRALHFLQNRKKTGAFASTQDLLYTSLLASDYAKATNEGKTDFKATLSLDGKKLVEKSFDESNILSRQLTDLAMKDVASMHMPAEALLKKDGDGTLYYELSLKYYLPVDRSPTREEGIIVSREYYALDDAKEEKPLVEFKAGENYKGHITIVAPHEMNYIVVQDLLPAGFEPIDMQLSTSSRAAALAALGEGEIFRNLWGVTPDYDDVIQQTDYGMSFAFRHQEVRDDSIAWSDESVPPGVYHIRYPVRATTAGEFIMPGASAFEFYDPEVFGRSRARMIKIKGE